MNNNIDPEKLKEAKAKLACHIEPPGTPSGRSGSPGTVAARNDKVRLTEMTTAGG